MVKTKKISEILKTAKVVTKFIQDKQREPEKITIAGDAMSKEAFIRLELNTLLEIYQKKDNDINLLEVGKPSILTPRIGTGQLQKKDYINAAAAVLKFIGKEKRLCNFVKTPIGKLNEFNLIDMYSRALNYYLDTKALPNYINVKSVGTNPDTIPIPATLRQYLEPTKNCQVKDPFIQNLAQTLKKDGPTIFNYARDKFRYNYYYNTRSGAIKALHEFYNNCCDQSHAVIALLRASGIPARYRHVYGKFSDGPYYHIHPQAWINGKWINLDSINKNNIWGYITNWTLIEEINIYRELPF